MKWKKRIYHIYPVKKAFEIIQGVLWDNHWQNCVRCNLRFGEVRIWEGNLCWNCFIKKHWKKYRDNWRDKFIYDYDYVGKQHLAECLKRDYSD